jgi:hypothetical protein
LKTVAPTRKLDRHAGAFFKQQFSRPDSLLNQAMVGLPFDSLVRRLLPRVPAMPTATL